jgi:hypothetical protein
MEFYRNACCVFFRIIRKPKIHLQLKAFDDVLGAASLEMAAKILATMNSTKFFI